VLLTSSRAALAESLRAGSESLVVIGGDDVSCRPYLQLAVRAGAPALLLLERASRQSARALISAGARGALREDVPLASLAAALDALRSGLIVLDPALVSDAIEAGVHGLEEADLVGPPERPLTRREQQILSLIAAGSSNKVIARRLEVSGNTVKFHLAAIFAKLGVTTRAEAVAEAIRRGVLSL
jgi:DNA-binding NarL/FixJ family response regulator